MERKQNMEQAEWFTFDWVEGDSILKVKFHKPMEQRSVIDAYCEAALSHFVEWSPEKPFLTLYDATLVPQNGVTPYLRQKTVELSRNTPRNLAGRAAVVLQKSPLMVLVRRLVEYNLSGTNTNVESRIFFKEEDAVQWLKEFH